MKTLVFSLGLLVVMNGCRHQKTVAAADATTSSTQTSGSTTTTTQQGEVQITTDESTTATITIYNPPDDSVVTTVAAQNPAPVQDTANDIYRLTISFISKGAGIDMKTQEAFENWLNAQPKHPAYEKTRWGREGETNYCLRLNELSTREQEIFVKDVRTQLTDKQLVFVTEYAKCKGKKVN